MKAKQLVSEAGMQFLQGSPQQRDFWIQAAYAELTKMATATAEWQPIDTAPPAPTHLLLFVPQRGLRSLIVEGWYSASVRAWVAENGGQLEPSHWMPLPAAPTFEQQRDALREVGIPEPPLVRLGLADA